MLEYHEITLEEMENWAEDSWIQGASASVRVQIDGEWTRGRLVLQGSPMGQYRVIFGLTRLVYKGGSLEQAVEAYNEFQFVGA